MYAPSNEPNRSTKDFYKCISCDPLTRHESRMLRYGIGWPLSTRTVSTLTRHESRMLRRSCQRFDVPVVFQPSPGMKAGCYQISAELHAVTPVVSTLTRHESRMLRQMSNTNRQKSNCFNPHPA